MEGSAPETTKNPITAINNIIGQILGSANPQAMFNQVVASSKEAQNAMNMINQYGNGDPRSAFMNYMTSNGKQSLGQEIMKRFGLY